jgi:hypothetical protein
MILITKHSDITSVPRLLPLTGILHATRDQSYAGFGLKVRTCANCAGLDGKVRYALVMAVLQEDGSI